MDYHGMFFSWKLSEGRVIIFKGKRQVSGQQFNWDKINAS